MNRMKRNKKGSLLLKIVNFIKSNKVFFIFISLMFVFRSAIADWNHVPSGSMRPTILPGDYVWVDKLAYDVQIPFVGISIYRLANPKRGDIVVFESKVAGKRLIKRVIGIPGDVLSMDNNRLVINGEAAHYHLIEADNDQLALLIKERFSDDEQVIRWESRQAVNYSNFESILVPDGFYFMLGDNRNNSRDSRFIGLVPRDEIMGQSTAVILSLNYDDYLLPRSERYLKSF